MPRFISGSSGHVYGYDKSKDSSDEDELSLDFLESSLNKSGAANKSKETQKNSLDIFREELKRLQDEKDKKSRKSKDTLDLKQQQQAPTHLVPVPLKPDPRCPTNLTLKVNLNPKDRESSIFGSYDNGDPTTTNLYVGNLNPIVNENQLCDIFGKFGPLASIKIMWPRTDEERARNRNSGFVAYMSRIDAERALKNLTGFECKGYEMKLGKWSSSSRHIKVFQATTKKLL